MFPSYNQLKVHKIALSIENWLNLAKKTLPERPKFSMENGVIEIGQVVATFLGIPFDADEYYNQLYEYVHLPEFGFSLLSEGTLDKTIDNRQFQAVQKVLTINKEQNLSINRFVAFLDGEQLILKSENPLLHRKLREAMIETVSLFEKREPGGLHHPDLRRVLVDLVKWSKNHLLEPLTKADPKTSMPKFLWYGDFKKSHQYFLYYLMLLGCDLVLFHPDGKEPLAGIVEEQTFVYQYPNKQTPDPFPTEKRSRKTTVAYRASKEIESILHQDGSGLYKPWQLREYIPSCITLKTTYDELFLLGKELAMIRPGFEVENGHVKIPSLFAKIQGVSKNKKEYWERINGLVQTSHSLLIQQFPFTTETANDFRFHYRSALNKDGSLNPEKMIQAHYWTYSHLPLGLQMGIAHTVKQVCENPRLKKLPNESDEEIRIYLFSTAMHIPKNIIQLLEKFDYSQTVPKFVLYNNERYGQLSRSDAALLLLLNHFGADVVVYNPAGHNDIENYLDEELFDTHWLEDVVFDQEFRTASKLKKNFLHGFLKNLRGE
ncbi:YceG family protein [Neobacillus sp. SM06]|uniref:YceG family protein n=1 Tax=Neobacillus sp. SM06 TaxID=3422492 RepID=UPI003D2C65BD